MDKEIWKPVKNYEELYEVSNLGRVKSLGRDIVRSNSYRQKFKKKILSACESNCGYLVVGLTKDKERKSVFVHQLVAEAFLNHECWGHEKVVNHINSIKTDNRVENLEIVTPRQNVLHSKGIPYRDMKTVSINETPDDLKKGYKELMIKDAKDVIPLRRKYVCTQSEAAKMFGCSTRKIQMFESLETTDPYLIWCYDRFFRK